MHWAVFAAAYPNEFAHAVSPNLVRVCEKQGTLRSAKEGGGITAFRLWSKPHFWGLEATLDCIASLPSLLTCVFRALLFAERIVYWHRGRSVPAACSQYFRMCAVVVDAWQSQSMLKCCSLTVYFLRN